ncbi:uncharacterized protein LOC124469526 [Hypomesus transpacificus]|uniref:uncharacterized protein LOC124469526 n=1 Tax=Hypomesus transpacificus TaxID=137520 RepID=UPI001F07294D|nr:uncharacterized protein LOC124469526 [Hypomesus transpacificus]XP_046878845.1 uncharacterized protein LOC124469526 [Hypomesus transpacificus]
MLMRDGQIVEQDARYRSLISVNRNGGVDEVVISRLSARHDGLYEIRDREGNLVSSTALHVIEKMARWRAVLKSITVPSGLFVTLAGFILFMKRFPNCGVAQILSGLRAHHPQATNPPRINVQDFSPPSPQHSGVNNQPELPMTPTKWSSSPVRSGYTPVLDREPRLSPGLLRTDRKKDETSTSNMLSAEDPNSRQRRTSISVPGASDCLRPSGECAQFHIKKEGAKERFFFSTLPLDTDTSGTCSVYTSDKLNFF